MLYRALNVTKNASAQEIKTSYRRLVLAIHPDKCGGSQEKFLIVQKAYETLSDHARRSEYDKVLNKKRERMRGFVRPPSLTDVQKPVSYKMADEKSYIFESAPCRIRCGLHYGDVVCFNDVAGCIVGLAADKFLYWCQDGHNYASRLCHFESDMAISSIQVLQRANLDGGRIHVPESRRFQPYADRTHDDAKSPAQRMFEELRRRERIRIVEKRLTDCVTDEEEERTYIVESMTNQSEELFANIALAGRALLKGLPIDCVTCRWLDYNTSPSASMPIDSRTPAGPLPSLCARTPQLSCDNVHCRSPSAFFMAGPAFPPAASQHSCRVDAGATLNSIPKSASMDSLVTAASQFEPTSSPSKVYPLSETAALYKETEAASKDDGSECSFSVHIIVDSLHQDMLLPPKSVRSNSGQQSTHPSAVALQSTAYDTERAAARSVRTVLPSPQQPAAADVLAGEPMTTPYSTAKRAVGSPCRTTSATPRTSKKLNGLYSSPQLHFSSPGASAPLPNLQRPPVVLAAPNRAAAPRFMTATHSSIRRLSVAAGNSTADPKMAVQTAKRYDRLSADELWAEEEEFMKEFEAKQSFHKWKRAAR